MKLRELSKDKSGGGSPGGGGSSSSSSSGGGGGGGSSSGGKGKKTVAQRLRNAPPEQVDHYILTAPDPSLTES